jgi:hypothetical protein
MAKSSILQCAGGLFLLTAFSFSQPCSLADEAAGSQEKSSTLSKQVRLHAEITNYLNPEFNKQIDDLISVAHDKQQRSQLLIKEQHYKKPTQKILSMGRDLAELCTAYRGFEQSSEAADVILDEKTKLKNAAAVAYVKQKQHDKLHAAVLTAMMQIAAGLGMSDEAQKSEAIKEGSYLLEELTDKDHADKTVEMLSQWCNGISPTFRDPLGGPLQIQAECKDVTKRAVQGDAAVKEIANSLHKYNKRSKFARTTAKVVSTTLSITALSPTIISPISQVAWTAYIATQGGPEQSKLLKEVYLAKRFESRYQTLNEEATLAVNSYNTAQTTKNAALSAFSQYVLSQLCQAPPAPELADKDKKEELSYKEQK